MPRITTVSYRSVGGASQFRISKVVNGIEYPIKWVNIANPAVKTSFHLVGTVTDQSSWRALDSSERVRPCSLIPRSNAYTSPARSRFS
jgi:hypothetical protein